MFWSENSVVLADETIALRCLEVSEAREQVDGEDSDWVRWFSGGPGSIQGLTEWILQNQQEWANGGPRLNWAIHEVGTDAIVGNVEVNLDPNWLGEGDVNISYGVFAAHRGQGIAARAVRLVCRWLTEEVPRAKQAVIQAEPENEHSLRIPRVLGFQEVGTSADEHGAEMVVFRLALR